MQIVYDKTTGAISRIIHDDKAQAPSTRTSESMVKTNLVPEDRIGLYKVDTKTGALVPKDFIKVNVNGTVYTDVGKIRARRRDTLRVTIEDYDGPTKKINTGSNRIVEVALYTVKNYDELEAPDVVVEVKLRSGVGNTTIVIPNKIDTYYLSIENILITIGVA